MNEILYCSSLMLKHNFLGGSFKFKHYGYLLERLFVMGYVSDIIHDTNRNYSHYLFVLNTENL